MKYTIAGEHISIEIDDGSVRFVDPRSNLGRRILGEHGGGLTVIDDSTASDIKEASSLIIAICDVVADLQKDLISLNHAIAVIGNAMQLFDNSVPEPEKPKVLTR